MFAICESKWRNKNYTINMGEKGECHREKESAR